MLTIDRILCATDFSDASYEAVTAANDLAIQLKAELILVHVVQPITPLPDVEASGSFDLRLYEDTLRRGMESKLNDLAARKTSAEVRAKTVTLYGHPAEMIVGLAESQNAGLIVIATHGMSGWRHYAFGSVAQKVLQGTSRPVLVVRGKSALKK